MDTSAGLILLKDKKILLVHPTNAPWYGRHSIPKGLQESKEELEKTSIREVAEEVGINITLEDIQTDYNYDKSGYVDYKPSKFSLLSNKVYKRVWYYIVDVNSKNLPDVLSKTQLQLTEVDDARFYNYTDAKKRIFWRMKGVLKNLKKWDLIN